MRWRTLLAVAVVLMLLLPACTDEDEPEIANPASVYCKEQGGTLDLRSTDRGTAGYCVFPDGSECEEWGYYRGECAPGQ